MGVFFLIFDRVLSRTGRLSKFKPRDSESESDSSTYTKSELFADEASEKEVELFRLWEKQSSVVEFRLVSVEGVGDGEEVGERIVFSGITSV